MVFFSLEDPEFWKQGPKEMEHLKEGRGKGAAAFFLMGRGEDNPPTIAALKMEPGTVIPRHAHECYRFEVVVQGTLLVDGKMLKPGDVMFSEPNVIYGPHTAGPEGCTTFEIFNSPAGMTKIIMDMRDGPVLFDVSTREARQKMREAQRRQLTEIKKGESK